MKAIKAQRYDLSVVVVAHSERRFVYQTLRSIQRARLYAEQRGLRSELIVILNRADRETTSYVKRFAQLFTVEQLVVADFRAVGPARNLGVRQAHANIVSICDGDDLYSENWFWESHRLAVAYPHNIYHPRYLLAFGHRHYLLRLPEQADPSVDVRQLLVNHCWSSIITTNRQNIIKHPYTDTPFGSGFGHEDWHFNAEAIAAGLKHATVPQTARFYRTNRTDNANQRFNQEQAVIPASKLFEPTQFELQKDDIKPVYPSWWRLLKLIHRYTILPLFLRSNQKCRSRITKRTVQFKKILKQPLSYEEKYLFGREYIQTVTAPAWLWSEAHRLSEIEPSVFIRPKQTFELIRTELIRDPGVPAYAQLINSWPRKQYSHVIILPRLSLGGAEHATIELANNLARNFNAKILFVLTNITRGDWRQRLSPKIDVLPLGTIFKDLNDFSKRFVLFRVLLQRPPKCLLVVNDAVGWWMVETYGQTLSKITSIFAVDYLNWIETSGLKKGYGREALPNNINYYTRVFTDSVAHRDYLRHYLGCPPNKIINLNTPVGELPSTKQTLYNPQSTNILWASRLDRQKRIDILLLLAQRLPEYTFYVYGRRVIDKNDSWVNEILAKIKQQRNIVLMGEFSDYHELAARQYLCFVHTASSEGLPVTLIQIAVLKIPIVAAHVGGVSQIINDQTGYLIDPFDSVDQYQQAVEDIAHHPERASQKMAAAHHYALSHHTREYLTNQLKKLPDFVHPKSAR